MLVDAAVKESSGLSDPKKFRASLKRANFNSLRGNFNFNNNNFPIQDIILQRVEKGSDGKLYEKFLEVVKKDVADPHHTACPLK
jgi:branched-chain amino acid transport system substrate-binding protein